MVVPSILKTKYISRSSELQVFGFLFKDNPYYVFEITSYLHAYPTVKTPFFALIKGQGCFNCFLTNEK